MTATLAQEQVRLARRSRVEIPAWALLVLVALVLRLIELDERPFHHDESQDAYFSWLFFTTGDYAYDPLLHGPLRFYLTAFAYLAGGDSDFTARLAPALMGAGMVGLPFLLREQLGRVAAFAAAIALAIGPSYLYFSRFAREDIYIACITLGLLVATFRFLDRPARGGPALIGALLALSFATKESTFITVFIAGTFFVAALFWQARRAPEGWRGAPLVRTVASVGWEPWAWGLAAFLAVFTVLFTTFLTHAGGLWDGMYEGLHYWIGQHGKGRGGEAWWFYLVVLLGEEWPAVLLGAVGAVWALRRPTLLRVFLVWAFVVSLGVYSWAGEKFAWLVLHPLLPLLLLAGLGVQAIWAARRAWPGWLGLVLVIAGLAYAAGDSYWINARHGADPRSLLVSTQTAPAVLGVRDEVERRAAAAARAGRPLRLTIDTADGAAFPYAWYFRHLPAGYATISAANPPAADVMILTQASRDALRAAGALDAYDVRPFAFRVWWVHAAGRLTPASFWRWLTRRQTWSPTGGMPEFLAVRRGA